EDQITYPIVSTMLSAPRVKVARGFSFFGASFVYVIFEDRTDIYWARSRVLEYLNEATRRLPEGVTPTLGPDATGVGWGFEYALVDESGRLDLAQLRSLQDWTVRYWLKSVPGVADVAGIGGYVKQYQVQVDPATLLAYNVSLQDLAAAIRKSNNDVGGGVVEMTGREYMVRGRGYLTSTEDLERVVVGTDRQGTPILLRNVAKVQLGPEMRRGIVELNGEQEVVGGIVVVRFGENTLDVIERVKEKIREMAPALPEGVKIVPTYDRSDLILRSIATLKEKLIEESLIVSLVCIVFLFHFRSALVPILTLPLAILISFIPMFYLGISSNIMSLGGIAIAIGVMVDAAIVMVENAHKRLEGATTAQDRVEAIIAAAREVGRPLFFSLLIITVSFLPVFTLEAQEGRLFRPLAFTKTFAMFFASLLSITLVPLLMVLLIRGRIRSEGENPLARGMIALYQPAARWTLRRRKVVIGGAVFLLLATIPVYRQIGSEFMPPLDEGTILYMPTTLPGISITESQRLLQIQDRLLKQVPEVEQVFGKAGRAETATDPAPLEMMESVVALKPEDQWREGMTTERIVEELDRMLKIPGVSNAWTMPVKGRIDMLSTGIRTPVGIKIFGPDLETIQGVGGRLERILMKVPGTRNVFAERVAGGYYLDFQVDRDRIARYGLTVEEVGEVIETALGGTPITWTIEGRERYPVNLRYARELRDDLDKLRRVLVPTPMGMQIPLGQLADLKILTGPTAIRSEEGQLVGYVLVDVAGRDIGGYVEEARERVGEELSLPKGTSLTWSGQYEYLKRAEERLKIVIPLTLGIIFFLLYLNFKSTARTLMVMLSLPFALIGAVWTLWLLDYNLSVAVWVGIIALAGVAAEIGVVMLVYLDAAFEARIREGRLATADDRIEAVIEGAVKRLRPIVMTVAAIILGLLPILWGHGTGTDVMKRIAAPMVGGMVTTTLLVLLVIPAVYLIWRGSELRHSRENGNPER
ncbi:MAG: efflux RND transporter permease subunit, partial [Nitrospirae bacterium]|nr:efflux RND transporter permease subunit [Nitrospirota bacterium]